MNFQLIKPINPNYSATEQILTNRGLPHHLLKEYLNTTDEHINSYELFGKENLFNAANALIQTVLNEEDAWLIIDSDCDGFTSSALLLNYLYMQFPAWVENHLNWFMHEGKQHGLSDFNIDALDEKVKLFLIPDAGSNDYEYHKKLAEKGVQIIILDHHEAEKISDHAIVINNQLSDYPNKDMSGVGVTWQFCKYLDSLVDTNYADNFLDLVALGMDADMMSMLSLETKHLITKGLQQIKNPFFDAMVEKNSYSMKNKITPMGVAFYVAPYVNAIVRSGTQEEKEIVFKAMLNFKAFEKIPSNKRGHRPGEMEQIYVQAVRTVTNVKNRQTRAQDAGIALLEKMIEDYNLLDHKVLLFLLEPGQIDKNIAGLIANKFMSKYQRPCCILTKVIEEEKIAFYNPDIEYEEWDPTLDIAHGGWRKEKGKYEEYTITKVSYQGSARGCDKTGVINFKEICEQTGCIMYAEGHQGAFGLGIYSHTVGVDDEVAGDLIYQFLDKTDEILKDINEEPIYYVDYIYSGVEVNPSHVLDIADLDYLWGKDVDEPYIAIKNLKISKDMITLMSPNNKPTLKITLPNKVSLIKFGSNEDEFNTLYPGEGYVELNIIGRCNKNEWNGYVYPQIYIEDYEVIDRVKYIF